MNIDELTNEIKKVSSEKNVQKLADLIQKWKTDGDNAIELRENIERYLGNAWIDKKSNFEKIYEMWSKFRNEAINGIGGMTMNERLDWFGMFELFDNAKNDLDQKKIYDKLMARK